jgi:hypothetical protein
MQRQIRDTNNDTVAAAVGARAASASGQRSIVLGSLMIVEALLAFAPLLMLGSAIGWPESLGEPAAAQLAAIGAHPQAVAHGYAVYLVYSILVLPLMAGITARALGRLDGVLAMSIVAFAALSVLARAIGILRWLTVMPDLAQAQARDPGSIERIAPLFDALHAYGGGIGEILGVSLFMALALGTLGVAALREPRARTLPRWLAASAVLVALILAGVALPALGFDLQVPMAVAVTSLSIWMLAAGVWLLRRA